MKLEKPTLDRIFDLLTNQACVGEKQLMDVISNLDELYELFVYCGFDHTKVRSIRRSDMSTCLTRVLTRSPIL